MNWRRDIPLQWLLAVFVLSLLTFAVFRFVPRYETSGTELLAAAPFTTDLDGWKINGNLHGVSVEDGVLVLRNDDPASSISIERSFPVTGERTTVRVRADVALEDVVPGVRSWHRARIFFVGQESDGKLVWDRKSELYGDTGSRDFAAVEDHFSVPPTDEASRLSISLHRATGTMRVRSIDVTRVADTPYFDMIRNALIIPWALLGMRLLWGVARGIEDRRVGAVLAGAGVVVAITILMPQDMRGDLLNSVSMALFGHRVDLVLLAKVGHFFMFAGTAFLVRLARPSDKARTQLFLLALVAAASEILQMFAVNRHTEPTDWLVDCAGILLGYTIAQTLLVWQARRHSRVSSVGG